MKCNVLRLNQIHFPPLVEGGGRTNNLIMSKMLIPAGVVDFIQIPASFLLSAHDPGGTWSVDGITEILLTGFTGIGNHTIKYDITDANGCTDFDQINIRWFKLPGKYQSGQNIIFK